MAIAAEAVATAIVETIAAVTITEDCRNSGTTGCSILLQSLLLRRTRVFGASRKKPCSVQKNMGTASHREQVKIK